eukprot:m.55389 g.55389  ORF g.55389 m.55389 type:complete len:697 (+) comp7751_c0_seq1:116-2206(+)
MNEEDRQLFSAAFDQFEEELREDILKSYGSSNKDQRIVDELLDDMLGRSNRGIASRPLSTLSLEDFGKGVPAEAIDTTLRYMEKSMRKLGKIIRTHGRPLTDGTFEISLGELRHFAPEFVHLECTVETAIENNIMKRSSGQTSGDISEDEDLVLSSLEIPQGTYTMEQVRKSTRGRRHRRRIAQPQPQNSNDRSFSFSVTSQGKSESDSKATFGRDRPESMYSGNTSALHKETFGANNSTNVRSSLLANKVQDNGVILRKKQHNAPQLGNYRRNTICISNNSASPQDAMDVWKKHSSTVNEAKGILLEDAMATLYNEINLRDVISVEENAMSQYATLVWGETSKNKSGINSSTISIKKAELTVCNGAISSRHPHVDIKARPELDVDWSKFQVPELNNFLRILEAEELLHERQVRSVFNAKKIRLEQQLTRLRDEEEGKEQKSKKANDGMRNREEEEEEEEGCFEYDDDTMIVRKPAPLEHINSTSPPMSPTDGNFTRQRSSRVITNTEGRILARKSAERRESHDRHVVDDLLSSFSKLQTKGTVEDNRKTVLIDDLLAKDVAKGKAVSRWVLGQMRELVNVIVEIGERAKLGTEHVQKGAPTATVADIEQEGIARGKLENVVGLLNTARETGVVFYDHKNDDGSYLLSLPRDDNVKVTLLKTSIDTNDQKTLTFDNLRQSVRRGKKKKRGIVETEV